jgi:nucleotide-binding universal stress UspA family protein
MRSRRPLRVDEAATLACRSVVMHALTLKDVLIGSVAQALMNHAPIPVLIVR